MTQKKETNAGILLRRRHVTERIYIVNTHRHLCLAFQHTLKRCEEEKIIQIKESFSELYVCQDVKEDEFIFVSYWPL